MPRKKTHRYEDSFKKEVLAAVDAGHRVADVAVQHKVTESAIYDWLKKRKSGVSVIVRNKGPRNVMGPGHPMAVKIAAAYLANAVKHWDTERARPLVQLALIELKEAM